MSEKNGSCSPRFGFFRTFEGILKIIEFVSFCMMFVHYKALLTL